MFYTGMEMNLLTVRTEVEHTHDTSIRVQSSWNNKNAVCKLHSVFIKYKNTTHI